MKKRHEQKLVILSLALLALFNMPFVLMYTQLRAVNGIPIFYIAIFGIWALSILISYIVIKKYHE